MKTQGKIGRYQVLNVIGQGGMGKVYKAVDPATKKTVIIKQLLVSDKLVLTKRFQREATIMNTLNHKNIARVYKYFKIGSSCFLVMEFIDGLSIANLIEKKKKVEPMPTILIFREACKGLKYAHDRGIIHRDIKPDNVMISKRGEVKLLDFGIATALPGEDERLTKTGAMMGTPAYMSPEQILSSKYVVKASDIYSMGVLLYEMITGIKPFPNSLSKEAIIKISRGDFVKPHKINPQLPGFFKKIIKKTINIKKEKRYKDLQELIDVLSKRTDKKLVNQQKINAYIAEYIFGVKADYAKPNKITVKKLEQKKGGGLKLLKIDNLFKNFKTVILGRVKQKGFILIDDSLVSRNHTLLGKQGNKYYIADLKSSNGTFLNNKRLPSGKKIQIKNGDLIRIGKTRIKII